MWLVAKDDSIYFKDSVFIGKKNDEYCIFVLIGCPCDVFTKKDELVMLRFQLVDGSMKATDAQYKVKYNNIHEIILSKDMVNTCAEIKKFENIDVYYYPKSIKFSNLEHMSEFLKEVIDDERRNN